MFSSSEDDAASVLARGPVFSVEGLIRVAFEASIVCNVAQEASRGGQ